MSFLMNWVKLGKLFGIVSKIINAQPWALCVVCDWLDYNCKKIVIKLCCMWFGCEC